MRVWLAAQDGHGTCGLLYPAVVPGFRFPGECPGLSWGGALMPLLPRLGRVDDLRFSPPEVLPHTALRASDYHFPHGGVGIVNLQKLKPAVPVFGHRSPAKDRAARLIALRCPPADAFQARCLLSSTQGGYSLRSV